jgi:hypothetical protein
MHLIADLVVQRPFSLPQPLRMNGDPVHERQSKQCTMYPRAIFLQTSACIASSIWRPDLRADERRRSAYRVSPDLV